MAEQDSKPTAEVSSTNTVQNAPKQTDITPTHHEVDNIGQSNSQPTTQSKALAPRYFLPAGLGVVALLVGCFWWGSQTGESSLGVATSTPAITQIATTEPISPANAALTRVASSLAQASTPMPTVTATPIDAAIASVVPTNDAMIALPTVTPTIIPSPVATRTVEMNGDVTLRLQLNSDAFESNGQPITLNIRPRSYVLGGNVLTQNDQWCMQVGPTGLVFDLSYTLQPVTEDLLLAGELQLYDGFCGTLGNLGNRLATTPINFTIPAATTAQISPALQAQGRLLGLPDLLDISTGVYLNLNIRNPSPR